MTRPPEEGERLAVLLVLASSGWGGTERAFVDLAGWLGDACDVTVAVPADAVYIDRLPASVRAVASLPSGSRRNPATIVRLARLIAEVGPDLVHTHAARATEMVYWARLFGGPPQVATKHNARPRWVFSRVRHVSAVSEHARASIPAARSVSVVYNGVAPREPPPVAKPETFRVVGVGRLHRHKAFDRLVRAVAALPFECTLEIAGEGPERPRLEALIRELDLVSRVLLSGHREDVPELLAGAHVQVVSSRTEGFSLALVEGLLYCDVVLSTPVGVAPEILPPELLVEPDAIASRLVDVRARYDDFATISSAARTRARERFSPDRVTAAYRELYRRAVRDA